MTGPEHYREAERLIAVGEYDEGADAALVVRDIALAQVHATLALAAATARPAFEMPHDSAEAVAWRDVCGHAKHREPEAGESA
jgi:hypothetical protein